MMMVVFLESLEVTWVVGGHCRVVVALVGLPWSFEIAKMLKNVPNLMSTKTFSVPSKGKQAEIK